MLSWLLATSQTKIQGLQARELPAGHLPFFSVWELHVWQRLYGCELAEDGSERGYDHYAYDGKDFLSFNKATLNWTAINAEAEMTKKKWDAELDRGWRKKMYLEGECFAWLKKCLEYGTEARARKRAEPPVVTIRSKTEADGMEILLCQAHGFYPREIDASWRRDGEVWLEDTLQESVAPNSDGTYHYQLSVRIDPKERGCYRCHVEHDGLQEPLDVAVEEAASTAMYFRMGGMGISLLLLVVLYGCIGYWTKKKEEEEKSTTSDDVLESVMNYSQGSVGQVFQGSSTVAVTTPLKPDNLKQAGSDLPQQPMRGRAASGAGRRACAMELAAGMRSNEAMPVGPDGRHAQWQSPQACAVAKPRRWGRTADMRRSTAMDKACAVDTSPRVLPGQTSRWLQQGREHLEPFRTE